METKTCKKCGKELDIRLFHLRSDTGTRRGVCSYCRKKIKKPRFEFLEEQKTLLEKGLKKCSLCGKIKSINDFWLDKSRPDKKTSSCIECRKKPNLSIESKEKIYIKRLKKLYKLNDLELHDFINKSTCDICGNMFKNKKHKNCDHDHNVGKYRGALCTECNFALGYFKDNVYYIKKAIEYLNKNI